MYKVYSLALVIILATLSVLWVGFASAQAIPKPSVPEFSIKYIDRSYTVPANYTYETNPYNGERIKTGHGEYRVDNQTLEIRIKNQPFTPYQEPGKGELHLLCYNVSWRGHFDDTWNYWGYYRDSMDTHSEDSVWYLHRASEAEYTVFVFGFGTDRQSTLDMPNIGKLPENTMLDFRVQALFGYYNEVMYDWVPGFRPSYKFVFTGESSDWSGTQTINLSAGTTVTQPAISPTVSPTSTPTETPIDTPNVTAAAPDTQTTVLPDLDWMQVAVLVLSCAVAVLAVGMVLLWRRIPR